MNHFLKKMISILSASALLFSLCTVPFASGSLDHFEKVRIYEDHFTDIDGWYESYVITGYEYGLFDGTGADHFSPNSSMTVGEAIKLAACLHQMYTDGTSVFPQVSPWWKSYEAYLLQKGVIQKPYKDYSNAITRAEFAILFAAVLPEEATTVMNELPADSIPDVPSSASYAPAVYRLYRAGILTGSDPLGTFHPDRNILRNEMAAIITRMVCVRERKAVFLEKEPDELTAEQIYAICSPSVFSITTFDQDGEALYTGSGVFLSSDGAAVTNWHVLDGSYKAKITTASGETYPIMGVTAFDPTSDLALIRISGSHFSPIKINETGALLTGATIYTIGNPQGMTSSLSAGLISSSRRPLNGMDFIQVTAPISSGSSGGALLNSKGELIGITSATINDAQNLNLAIPVQLLSKLHSTPIQPMDTAMTDYYDNLDRSMEVSAASVLLKPEEEAVITFTVPHIPKGYSLSYETSDGSVVQCSWGKWEKDQVDLTLIGRSAGNCSVTIILHNRQDKDIGARIVRVTVQ